jgi:tRNA pseudouridine32 synthase / 23S rRNA pseudouridine746 synthase
MTPEEMVSRLLYRDGLMLVIDKPAGVAVHKGPKGGACLEDDFPALQFGLPKPPALAHRLDRETSGCLVLGRHRKALANLSDLFRHGKVGKTYWAVVEGGPAESEGRIDLAMSKRDDNRGWWMKPNPAGLPSSTTWRVMGRWTPNSMQNLSSDAHALSVPSPFEGEGTYRASGEIDVTTRRQLTWLALEPLTGRTHQLRVHCAAMGWPIVGDSIYGAAPRAGGPRLQLHAREVTVPLYKNREPVKVTAPVPPHMHELLKVCGWNGEDSPPVSRVSLRSPGTHAARADQ